MNVFILLASFCALTPNDDGVRGADDSASIQRAVDRAAASGTGKVVIPRFNERTGRCGWAISRAILLPGDMTVVIDNATLTMADGVYENFFRSANIWTEKGRTPAGELRDIRIVGVGNAVLDGGEANDLCEATSCRDGRPHVRRNCPVLFANVRNFSVSGLTVARHRYWGLCFNHCRYGKISDIRFVAGYDRRNQDGINLRNGCSEIAIENISGQTGDDMIALSAIDSPRADEWAYLVEGRDDDIHDVSIRNVTGAAVGHPLVALRNHNGAKIYNISIENVADTEFSDPCLETQRPRYALIRIGNGIYWSKSRSVLGDTSGIVIRNIAVRYSDVGIVVNATLRDSLFSGIVCSGPCRAAVSTFGTVWLGPGATMENVTIENATVAAAEGATVFDSRFINSDDHLSNVVLRNCTVAANGSADTIDFKRVDVESGPRPARLVDGVSEPFRVAEAGPIVRWRAKKPAGTDMRVTFAVAPDAGGAPGSWGEFVSYTNNASLPAAAGDWVRYCVTRRDAEGKKAILHFVNCGNVMHTRWTVVDGTMEKEGK